MTFTGLTQLVDEVSAGKEPYAGRSSRQGYNPVGECPTMTIAHISHVEIPHSGRVTNLGTRGVNGLTAWQAQTCHGRCDVEAYQVKEIEDKRMVAAPKYGSLLKSHCSGHFVRLTSFS